MIELKPPQASSLPEKPGRPSARGVWTNPRARLAAAVGAVVALALAFFEPLRSLLIYAAGSEVNSHILLVPLVSIYLLYIGHRDFPKSYASSPWIFLGFAAVAVLALAIGTGRLVVVELLSPNDHLTFTTLAFVFSLAAFGFLFLGKKWMAATTFPIGFLFFMVPLPDAVIASLENASKLASAETASWFFNLAGIPNVRDGVLFQIPGIVIEVAKECSGIRSSLILMITSLLAAHLFLKSPWRRFLLVALVIPLGVIRNGFRIVVIGWLCVHIGPEMINSAIHRRGGPVFFVLSLFPLFFFLWWLRRGEPPQTRVPADAGANLPLRP